MVDDGQRASTRRRFLSGTASAAALLAGCAGGDDRQPGETPATSDTVRRTDSPTATATRRETPTEAAGWADEAELPKIDGSEVSSAAYPDWFYHDYQEFFVAKLNETGVDDGFPSYNERYREDYDADVIDPRGNFALYDMGTAADGRPKYVSEVAVSTNPGGPFPRVTGYDMFGEGFEEDVLGTVFPYLGTAAVNQLKPAGYEDEKPEAVVDIRLLLHGIDDGTAAIDERDLDSTLERWPYEKLVEDAFYADLYDEIMPGLITYASR
jgi:hypothetical protein